jgi:carboxypeptidase Q
MKRTLATASFIFLAPLLCVAQPAEKVDLNVIHRIKQEALGRSSKVMDYAFYLTDVSGPRLQSSKGYNAAAKWAMEEMKKAGLENVHLEKWGPYGKGWNLDYFAGHMLEPSYQPIIAYPVAYSAGTNGVLSGSPVMIEMPQTQADIDKLKGTLAGKIVMVSAKRDLELPLKPYGAVIPMAICTRLGR